MFIKSAASDTLQGRAIHDVNLKWGDDKRCWKGRETIGIPVCKKKYAPFSFKIIRDDNGRANVTVERMFGCRCHSNARKSLILQHGCRRGWEPFGQWSLQKAQDRARQEAIRINLEEGLTTDESSSEEDNAKASLICHNGNCTWKYRQKYDDITQELTGKSSDEKEIYHFYDSFK
mmetsp:Transcript_30505/g.34781  ORF Transcript_30505/g.34781 Transcript_30505/m.34781 type:complete len:175 (+) Transcript_30505:302-826(+)